MATAHAGPTNPLLGTRWADLDGSMAHRAREARRYKRAFKRDEAQRTREREATLRLDAQHSSRVQQEHLAKQTAKTRAMMAQSAQESRELRERCKLWPRTKRRIASDWDNLKKQHIKHKAMRQKKRQQH